MEFFDKLGKKATEAYKVTADKTGKIAKEAKLKMKISELKGNAEDLYIEIGKKVYDFHVSEKNINIKKDLEEECKKLDDIKEEIEELNLQCLDLNDKKRCVKCATEIEKSTKFCPSCGAKQTEEKKENVIEVEKVKEDKKEQSSKEEKSEKKVEKKAEEKAKKATTKEKDDLQKTVEVESSVKLDDKEENQQVKPEK